MRSGTHCESPDVQADHEAAVRRAITGMQQLLFEPLRLEHVAAAAIYSPFHFHRTFRQITSTTPARFLASLRMQRAKQLLADSDLTVTVISGLVGYESLGTFTTQFGRLVGTSPGRFRHLVDRCGTDLRLSDLDLGNPTPGRLPVLCSAPDGVRLECRTTLIGLFDGELPSGSPTSFTMLRDACAADIVAPGSRSVLALSVPDDTLLSDLAVGSLAGALVGRAAVPGRSAEPVGRAAVPGRSAEPVGRAAVPGRSAEPVGRAAVSGSGSARVGQPVGLGSGSIGSVLELKLTVPRPVDPPVVSAAPVQYLVGRR